VSKVVLLRAARCAGITAIAATVGLAGSALAASKHPTSGGATLAANASKTGDSKHLGDRVLWPGMTGHDVRVLQQYLTFAGFSTTVTGNFGMSTRQSVIAFERSHHLRATGIVTAPVAHALRSAVAASLPHGVARINSDGTATAPVGAPAAVQTMVAAANRIIHTSYCYAGGHGSWNSSCYDCSGSVGYVLHAAGMLSSPEPSGSMESWGSSGAGRWISVYANSGHVFIVIAGRAFDTADFGGPNIPSGSGPRWRSDPTGNLSDGGGYVVRHPAGL
jgi:cell wall-associated NlpC family hydrolase